MIRRRRIARVLLVIAIIAAAIYLWNASWRVTPAADAETLLLAHRGVHQIFSREGLENDTCTAERIVPPEHEFLENTIASMQAAFAAGADVVELDVHPTTDGQFAVLHDWTIDCRTEGTGETRSHDMAYLKTLDVGYGYTADGEETFPFRGKGIGLMPELKEVFAALPEGKFLVNFKSNEEREGDMLATLLADHPEWRTAVWGAYGGGGPTTRAKALIADLNAWSNRSQIDCVLQYAGLGWTGYVPQACRDTSVMIPINIAPFLWGWPNLLIQRFREAGSNVILIGPYESGDAGTSGIDSLDLLAQVPADFDGYIWTNRIELIGPAQAND